MDKAEEQFRDIFSKFENSSISVTKIQNLKFFSKNSLKWRSKLIVFVFFGVILYGIQIVVSNSICLIDMPLEASRLFRGPEYCDICERFNKVDKISNVSSTFFLENYVNPSHPVVITDGALNWPAKHLFTFDFFKNLFDSMEINRSKDKNCQFFPYKTEFNSLNEVFKMNRDRSTMKPGEKPWYVGWNNCNDDAGRYLKQFYGKPYFFSNMTENIALTWIFMGSPGHGAHMHVDNVYYPSWQAQLRGKKVWKLAPPPECYYKCQFVEVTVEPGEISKTRFCFILQFHLTYILVVLDTNRWYHQTTVLPGDISITIGSEFD